MRRFLMMIVAALVPAAAAAQDYMTAGAFHALTAQNALCYGLQANGSCNWVEIYDDALGPQITLRLATILPPGDVAVIAQEATWVGDAMCIRDGDFGILGMDFGQPPYFRFDLSGLVAQPQPAVQEIIDQLTPSIAPKTCFRFAPDPARPGGYLQHVFSDGTRVGQEDPITLVPLAQGSVLLTTP